MNSRFGKRRRGKTKVLDLDITSLLDILVILLVFLLKSYNASDLKLNLLEGIKLPNSKSRDLGSHAIIVQVDGDKNVFYNNRKIAQIDPGQETISELESELQLEIEKSSPKDGKRNEKDPQLNLVFDKSTNFKTMKIVMHTAAIAGYPKFKFIVQGEF